jgi:hypothetical protein
MADDHDPFYVPYLPNTPLVSPKPREPEWLWDFRTADHHTYSCRLLHRGEWGVEAQILRDGVLMHGRRYDTRALALQWAERENEFLEKKGDY